MTKSGSEPARVNLSSLPRPRLGKEGAKMKIIGCDFHPSYQQIASVDTDIGEHSNGRGAFCLRHQLPEVVLGAV